MNFKKTSTYTGFDSLITAEKSLMSKGFRAVRPTMPGAQWEYDLYTDGRLVKKACIRKYTSEKKEVIERVYYSPETKKTAVNNSEDTGVNEANSEGDDSNKL